MHISPYNVLSQSLLNLICIVVKTVMHSRLSCTKDCHALKTVMQFQLSCIKNCHAMKIVMHSGTALADFGIALVTTDQNVFIHVKKVYI